jgi:hypothetical protein
MEFSKKNLLSLIKENLEEMAMDFDTEDRPDQGIQNKLAQGDTPLKKIPFPKTGDEPNKNFQELLASERYRQVINNLRQYTGINTPLRTINDVMPLAQMMMTAHNQIVQTERAHRGELEKLSVDLVVKELNVFKPEEIEEGAGVEFIDGVYMAYTYQTTGTTRKKVNKLQFDVKIVNTGEIDSSDFNREQGQQENAPEVNIEVEEDLMDDLEKLDLEKAKRRFINSMIQGASEKAHFMYHYVPDKIEEITGSENLINQYGILMSINDTLYWQLSDEQMKMMMGGGGEGGSSMAGKQKVDRNSNPPKITVEAVNFPVLVHELVKAVMELISYHGDPDDLETFNAVQQSEDTLEKEVWDLRLGPAIWERMRKQFPEDILTDVNKMHLQNRLLMTIFKLPAKNLLVFAKEVVSGSENGKRLMNELMLGIEQLLRDQDYQTAMAAFNDDLDDVADDFTDDDMRNLLGDLGISLSDDDDDDNR